MHDADIAVEPPVGAHAPERALDVHEARHVGAADDVGTRLDDGAAFLVDDLARDFGLLEREGATEAAATIGVLHLDILEALDALQQLERRPNCQRVEILQAYLRSEVPGEMIRIRRQGLDGNYVYFKTRKRTVEGMKRIEMEERLTRHEFLDLLQQADPAYRPIRKIRYCLSENGLYYNIDIYPRWDSQALMEIELYGADDEVVFPEGIEVIREVSGEEQFTNPAIARVREG